MAKNKEKTTENSRSETKKKRILRFASNVPGGIRTRDLLVRSQTLYPAELRAHALTTRIIIQPEADSVNSFDCYLFVTFIATKGSPSTVLPPRKNS